MKAVVYFLIGLIAGCIFGFLWVKAAAAFNYSHLAHQGGHHFHHSLFAPLFVLISFLFKKEIKWFWIVLGAGAGILLHHVLDDGWIFITRD